MKLQNILVDIIYPPKCYNCHKNLHLGTRPLLCENCKVKISAYTKKCARCGNEFRLKEGVLVCDTCHSRRHPFDGVISAYFYKEGIRDTIVSHKFQFASNHSPFLATEISNCILDFISEFTQMPDGIVYIPSHKKRLRDRGYDSLLEIAEIVSYNTNLPILDNLIIRHKHVPQQSKMSLSARMRNVRGSFKVTDKSLVKGKSIILFDDVYTSGATTRECAKVLKRAGAKYILIATVAISS